MSSYNHADYLRQSIDSVLHQTFTDFELFIVDDASTDDSSVIIQDYTDPRIRVSKNGLNRNDKLELNRFIRERASGEYIAIHHSDNVWEPEKLQHQVAYLDAHPETGAVFTNAHMIDQDGRPFTDTSHFYYGIFDQPNRSRYEWLRFFWDGTNALCHPSVLIRKKCYEECGFYRNGLAQIADLDMWVRLCLKFDIHVMPEKLTRFRVRTDEGQSSGVRPETRIRSQFEFIHVLENYLEIPTVRDLVQVLPAAQEHVRPEGNDLGYVLARVALETPGSNPVHHLFGLEVLFDALSDPDRARRIEALYGFRHKDFAALTAKYDVFATEVRDVTRKLALIMDRIRLVLFPPRSQGSRLLRRLYQSIASTSRGRGSSDDS
jgi:hypothetical protein